MHTYIMMRPEMAPMKHESKDQRLVSTYVYSIQVIAPVAAQRLVTQRAMTDLKLKARVVPASKANHEPQMLINAISWHRELTGRWMTRCDGFLVEDFRDRKRGYDRYTDIAVAVAPELMWTGVPPAKSTTPRSIKNPPPQTMCANGLYMNVDQSSRY